MAESFAGMIRRWTDLHDMLSNLGYEVKAMYDEEKFFFEIEDKAGDTWKFDTIDEISAFYCGVISCGCADW